MKTLVMAILLVLVLILVWPVVAVGCAVGTVGAIMGAADGLEASSLGNTKQSPNGKTYKVMPGDTLSKIGFEHGVDWKELARLNNIQPPYALREGMRLRFPNGQGPPAGQSKEQGSLSTPTPQDAANRTRPVDGKAHMWIYVRNSEWSGVDVSAGTANDIPQGELTVTLYAGGQSYDFLFTQPLFADNPPVTSDAHFSPSITHTQVNAASVRIGGMWRGYRSLRCENPKRYGTRTVFACNYREQA